MWPWIWRKIIQIRKLFIIPLVIAALSATATWYITGWLNSADLKAEIVETELFNPATGKYTILHIAGISEFFDDESPEIERSIIREGRALFGSSLNSPPSITEPDDPMNALAALEAWQVLEDSRRRMMQKVELKTAAVEEALRKADDTLSDIKSAYDALTNHFDQEDEKSCEESYLHIQNRYGIGPYTPIEPSTKDELGIHDLPPTLQALVPKGYSSWCNYIHEAADALDTAIEVISDGIDAVTKEKNESYDESDKKKHIIVKVFIKNTGNTPDSVYPFGILRIWAADRPNDFEILANNTEGADTIGRNILVQGQDHQTIVFRSKMKYESSDFQTLERLFDNTSNSAQVILMSSQNVFSTGIFPLQIPGARERDIYKRLTTHSEPWYSIFRF